MRQSIVRRLCTKFHLPRVNNLRLVMRNFALFLALDIKLITMTNYVSRKKMFPYVNLSQVCKHWSMIHEEMKASEAILSHITDNKFKVNWITTFYVLLKTFCCLFSSLHLELQMTQFPRNQSIRVDSLFEKNLVATRLSFKFTLLCWRFEPVSTEWVQWRRVKSFDRWELNFIEPPQKKKKVAITFF